MIPQNRAPGRLRPLILILLALGLAPREIAAASGPGAVDAPPRGTGTADPLEAKICIIPPSPGPPLEEFGRVLWRKTVELTAAQCACFGDHFYEGGARVDFGLLASRYRDRLYFRTPRRILREWVLPAAGQPDSAVAWAEAFVRQFSGSDTLFVDLRGSGTPLVATGERGLRAGLLFRHWVARELTPADRQLAAALGVAAERFAVPPPEPVCPPGGG